MEATTKMEMVKRYEFDRLPRESVKAFAAFRTYLEMGADRSLAAAACKLGKSKVMMERWSRKYDWCGRVAAHASYVAEVERLAIEGLARERAIEWDLVHEDQRRKEWRLRTEYFELALEGIHRWKAQKNRAGSLEGLARLGEVFVKLGRLASGMPTEVKEVKTEIKATLEVEWEVALKKVYGRREDAKVIEAEVVNPKTEGPKSEGNPKAEEPKAKP